MHDPPAACLQQIATSLNDHLEGLIFDYRIPPGVNTTPNEDRDRRHLKFASLNELDFM